VHGLCAAVCCSALSTVVGFISDYIVTYSDSATIGMTLVFQIRVHRFASINLNNIICYATSHRLHQTTHCTSFCMLMFPSTLTCTQLTATALKCCRLPARISHCSFVVRVYCKCCGAPVPEYCSRNLRSCSLFTFICRTIYDRTQRCQQHHVYHQHQSQQLWSCLVLILRQSTVEIN
jgi:hypothetical protein